MENHQEDGRKDDGYARMKGAIANAYPRGWFVAIADDTILAAAADFHELERLLRAQGKDPRDVLVVEAGIEYPKQVTIFG